MQVKRGEDAQARYLFRLSIGVFFIGGFLSSVVSLLTPRLKLIFGLDYARALLVQLAFHSSYLIFAVPIALAIVRLGYMRAIALGLGVMATACLLLLGAHGLRSYGLVLAALALLSFGITFLQIAANTVVTVVGPTGNAASRLTLLQGFNSIGAVGGPLLCAPFLLGQPRAGLGDAGHIAPPFIFAVVVLVGLSLAYVVFRNLLPRTGPSAPSGPRTGLRSLADRRLLTGTAAIFAYVGAEVTIGTLLTTYLALPNRLGLDPVTAGRMVSLYWAGAMAGRIVGGFALRRLAPPKVLLSAAVGGAVLTLIGIFAAGLSGAIALLAVGLCNSIMYPTIYALAVPSDERATLASTLLCMAVVGGAIIPYLTGVIADHSGLAPSLLLSVACYLGVALFARDCMARRRPA